MTTATLYSNSETLTHQLFNLNKYANIVNIPIHVVLKMKPCHCKHNVNKWITLLLIGHKSCQRYKCLKSIGFRKIRQLTALCSLKPTRPLSTHWLYLNTNGLCADVVIVAWGRLHLYDLTLMKTNQLYRGTIYKICYSLIMLRRILQGFWDLLSDRRFVNMTKVFSNKLFVFGYGFS